MILYGRGILSPVSALMAYRAHETAYAWCLTTLTANWFRSSVAAIAFHLLPLELLNDYIDVSSWQQLPLLLAAKMPLSSSFLSLAPSTPPISLNMTAPHTRRRFPISKIQYSHYSTPTKIYYFVLGHRKYHIVERRRDWLYILTMRILLLSYQGTHTLLYCNISLIAGLAIEHDIYEVRELQFHHHLMSLVSLSIFVHTLHMRIYLAFGRFMLTIGCRWYIQ